MGRAAAFSNVTVMPAATHSAEPHSFRAGKIVGDLLETIGALGPITGKRRQAFTSAVGHTDNLGLS